MKQLHLAIASAAAVILAGGAASAQQNIRTATSWPGGPHLEHFAQGFSKQADALTGGKVKFQIFPAGTIGSPLKITETVQKKVAQAGHSWPGYDWGIDKAAAIFGGYVGSPPAEALLHWVYAAGGIELWREWRMEKFGVVGIPCGAHSDEIHMHSRKPVRTSGDLKGLKLRTSGAWAEIATALGASTVILPGAEVYPALERGVVDAIEWATPGINLGLGFHKVAKYVILPGVHQPGAVLSALSDSLVDGNPESFATPDGKPVTQEPQFLDGPQYAGHASRNGGGRGSFASPYISSKPFAFSRPAIAPTSRHRHRVPCRDAGRCADTVVRDVAPVLNPLHGRMGLSFRSRMSAQCASPCATEQAGGRDRQGAGQTAQVLAAVPLSFWVRCSAVRIANWLLRGSVPGGLAVRHHRDVRDLRGNKRGGSGPQRRSWGCWRSRLCCATATTRVLSRALSALVARSARSFRRRFSPWSGGLLAAQADVGKVLLGMFIPGFMLAGAYIIYIVIRCAIRPQDGPRVLLVGDEPTLGEKLALTGAVLRAAARRHCRRARLHDGGHRHANRGLGDGRARHGSAGARLRTVVVGGAGRCDHAHRAHHGHDPDHRRLRADVRCGFRRLRRPADRAGLPDRRRCRPVHPALFRHDFSSSSPASCSSRW